MDAFDVLGFAPALDLDAKLLEQRYRDLQRALHPDRFAQAASSERRASLARAVDVNEAYRVLRDPLKRAELLLARHGGEISETASRAADPALLMEVMELREALGALRGREQTGERDRLAGEVRDKQAAATEALRSALARHLAGDVAGLDAAVRALARLRYYGRFLDEVAVFEDALD